MSPLYITFLLVSSIAAIIVLSSKLKFNTFFVLLVVAAIVGFAAGINAEALFKLLKKGFGSTLEKIGLLIIFGTTLGVLLEKIGATRSLAEYILSKTGEKRAPLAVIFMGFLIGLPIFCDSGFVVLIGLVLSLSSRLPRWHVFMVGCLAASLFAVHCLIPPHPGITAAAGILKVDIGQAMLLGIVVAIPPTIVAYGYSKIINERLGVTFSPDDSSDTHHTASLPSPLLSFLPIIVPILLISAKSLMSINPTFYPPSVYGIFALAGEPMMAIFIGIIMTFPLLKMMTRPQFNGLLDAAIDKSGSILAVTAAGGAFGEVIQALELGKVMGEQFASSGLGLFIPFGLAAIFKTAQGSSTVAVISTASIVAPLLTPETHIALGNNNQLLTLMAAGAGSMLFSHTNDSYFWVISKFSKLDTTTTLRLQSIMTALMGITAFLTLLLISYWLK